MKKKKKTLTPKFKTIMDEIDTFNVFQYNNEHAQPYQPVIPCLHKRSVQNLLWTVSLCKLNCHSKARYDQIKIHKSLTLKDDLCSIQRRNRCLCNRSSDGSSAQGADHLFKFFPYVYVLVWRVINVPSMTPQIPLTVCYLTMLFNVPVKNRLFILNFNHLI